MFERAALEVTGRGVGQVNRHQVLHAWRLPPARRPRPAWALGRVGPAPVSLDTGRHLAENRHEERVVPFVG